jgi:hypothetical protein
MLSCPKHHGMKCQPSSRLKEALGSTKRLLNSTQTYFSFEKAHKEICHQKCKRMACHYLGITAKILVDKE